MKNAEALQIARIVSSDNTIVGLSRKLVTSFEVGDHSFEFDMSNVSFLQVGQICLLAMFGKWAKTHGGSGRIVGLDPRSNVFHYLQRIDFFNYLQVVVPEAFERHPSKTFVEIKEIINDDRNTANEIPAKFREIIEATSWLDKSIVSAIDNSFGEIMDNVLNHSRTDIPGIAVSQYYPNKNYVEFCVADVGIGIPASLRMNPKFKEHADFDLLLRAFEFGVGENVYGSNKCDEGFGCGYGLAFASKLARVSRGKLWVISKSDALCIDGRGVTKLLGCWFPGTVVCMRIPTNVMLTEEDLNIDGKARPNRPYYWDAKGNELEDIYGNDILW